MVNAMARRMFDLLEPIGVIPYSADEPNETMFALGFTNYWDTYFAGRAAPLGRVAPEVVDALYYNFAPGEVARGTEAHVLFALELEMPAEKFGRIHHLPAAQLNA
jgi:hypothetical protein